MQIMDDPAERDFSPVSPINASRRETATRPAACNLMRVVEQISFRAKVSSPACNTCRVVTFTYLRVAGSRVPC